MNVLAGGSNVTCRCDFFPIGGEMCLFFFDLIKPFLLQASEW